VILVDTSVWADHFRAADSTLQELLERRMVRLHPLILGELAMGNLVDWEATVARLRLIARPQVATLDETLALVAKEKLAATGLGWIDASLLASAKLSGARLWSRDRRLAVTAGALGIGMTE